jgi:hypothetical protein
MFEDIKGVIRNHNSKNRQFDGQTIRKNNDTSNTMVKRKGQIILYHTIVFSTRHAGKQTRFSHYSINMRVK